MKLLVKTVVIGFSILPLSGCFMTNYDDVSSLGISIKELNRLPKSAVRKIYTNKTIRINPLYMNSVQYITNTGVIYVWNPDKDEILVDLYKLRYNKGRHERCYYQPYVNYSTYRKGKFACYPLGASAQHIQEIAEGDIYNLESEKVPFIAKNDELTFDVINARLKKIALIKLKSE